MGDVEHAYSARIDVDVFGCRGWPGYGVCLDVLGDRSDDVQTASQRRSQRIACPTASPAGAAHPGRILARVAAGVGKLLRPSAAPHGFQASSTPRTS